MLEQITIHLSELERSAFLDTRDSNVYVVLWSRDMESEGQEPESVALAHGTRQLSNELQEACDDGVAGDFQIVGRYRPGMDVFEHVEIRRTPETMNLVVMVTEQGTAVAETALCPKHDSTENRRLARLNADDDAQRWIRDVVNPALACRFCGARS